MLGLVLLATTAEAGGVAVTCTASESNNNLCFLTGFQNLSH